MVVVKQYKNHKIYRNTYGVIEVESPDGTRFIVGLDDSKVYGNKKMIESGNTVKNAIKYIDYINRR